MVSREPGHNAGGENYGERSWRESAMKVIDGGVTKEHATIRGTG